MLLRISLVIAILAGVATLYFSHVKVAERITTLSTERDAAQSAQRTAEEQQRKAEKEKKVAAQELEKANKALAEKGATLDATNTKLAEQEKRANQLNEDLIRVTGERNEAQTGLAIWKQLGVSPEQIKNFKGDLAQSNEERDRFADENKILARHNNELKVELSRFIGPDIDPKMPSGLNGKVVAVDPKYDFVVLDIGGNQGVVPNGKLLVNRGGKLVAKVRVSSVEPNRSIANIMPDWKQGEVMEGDQVIY
jgi:multidrug efflux pump subunit AcrA (membrane-fusion protein)